MKGTGLFSGVGMLEMVTTIVLLLFLCLASKLNFFTPDSNPALRFCAPSLTPSLLLGCDDLGRDVVLSLIGASGRTLLWSTLALTLSFSVAAGLSLLTTGSLTGIAVHRLLLQSWLTLHPFLFLLLGLAILGPSPGAAVVLVALVRVPIVTRNLQGMLIPLMREPFYEAVRALGAGPTRRLAHVILAGYPSLRAYAGLEIAETSVFISSLSFLGLSASLDKPDLGLLMARNLRYLPGSSIPLAGAVVAFIILLFLILRLSSFSLSLLARSNNGR